MIFYFETQFRPLTLTFDQKWSILSDLWFIKLGVYDFIYYRSPNNEIKIFLMGGAYSKRVGVNFRIEGGNG